MDAKLESVGVSLICIEAALHAILDSITSGQMKWEHYFKNYLQKERAPRGLVKALVATAARAYALQIPERVAKSNSFLGICATRNLATINNFLRETGIQMTAANSGLTPIYSASKLKLSWRWPQAVRARRYAETLVPDAETRRFQFSGQARVAWLGRGLGANDYNVVTIEIDENDKYDMNVVFVAPPDDMVTRWKAIAREPAVQRAVLMETVLQLREAAHDVEETEAYLDMAVVPCLDLQFAVAEIGELTGLRLPKKYVIAQAAHYAKLQMNEHGGSVVAGVGMRADKGLPPITNARGVTLRFDKMRDGFVVVVQCTEKGRPDYDPGEVLVAWVYP